MNLKKWDYFSVNIILRISVKFTTIVRYVMDIQSVLKLYVKNVKADEGGLNIQISYRNVSAEMQR